MLDRLRLLEKNVAELESLRSALRYEELSANTQKEWALRYGLLESIQIVIVVACYLASKFNLGSPETYADCFRLLAQFEYISPELSSKLTAMVGLRNILVHEYMVVDLKRLFDFLKSIDDIREFAQLVRPLV